MSLQDISPKSSGLGEPHGWLPVMGRVISPCGDKKTKFKISLHRE